MKLRARAWLLPRLIAPLLLGACDDALVRPRPGDLPANVQRADSAALSWFALDPRVVQLGVTDTVRITAMLTDTADLELLVGTGEHLRFKRITGALYEVQVATSSLLRAHRPGDTRHLGALIQAGPGIQQQVVVNVRQGNDIAQSRAVGPGAQTTSRVINLRYDADFSGKPVPAALVREVYKHLGDDFDLIALVEGVRSPNHRTLIAVRNQVAGIGMARFDNGRSYGSNTRLQAIVQYPRDDLFDLGETSNIHEIAHRWINYTRLGPLTEASSHWPLSDLAYGIMGRTDTRTLRPAEFPFQFVEQPDARFLVQQTARATEFNDLELYLMGLQSADSVRPHFVFRDQAQVTQIRHGTMLRGPVDTVRISQIIAQEGARSPARAQTPTTLRVAAVVVSRGRLLNPNELTFFEQMAARGEGTSLLPYTMHGLRGETMPWFLATGGRGRMVTAVH